MMMILVKIRPNKKEIEREKLQNVTKMQVKKCNKNASLKKIAKIKKRLMKKERKINKKQQIPPQKMK